MTWRSLTCQLRLGHSRWRGSFESLQILPSRRKQCLWWRLATVVIEGFKMKWSNTCLLCIFHIWLFGMQCNHFANKCYLLQTSPIKFHSCWVYLAFRGINFLKYFCNISTFRYWMMVNVVEEFRSWWPKNQRQNDP